MPLVTALPSADLALSFLDGAPDLPERLTRDLKPGEVRLVSRGAKGDHAVAQPPADAAQARELGEALAKLAAQLSARTVRVAATPHAAALAGAALAASWKDGRYKGGRGDASGPGEGALQLLVDGLEPAEAERVEALLAGLTFARELVSAPANVLNPATLAREARTLEAHGLDVDVWDGAEVTARGMNLLSAVAAGSRHGPRLIRVTLPARGAGASGTGASGTGASGTGASGTGASGTGASGTGGRVLALVGKGITFDTGGYSIKPAAGMYGMKNDMGGAGTVLGTMRALAALRAHIPDDLEVRAYLAAAENMVGPDAMRPGDVYRAANGTTVEVTNTDAEGRLVLADTLCVACDEGASEVIDLATLTGVKVSALGGDIAALFSSDPGLSARLRAAAQQAGEYLWELPLHQPYLRAYQKNTIADLKNSDMVPAGGSIKAALFLQQFVSRPWAHLDIAGNAEKDGAATGWGVATLVNYVLGR